MPHNETTTLPNCTAGADDCEWIAPGADLGTEVPDARCRTGCRDLLHDRIENLRGGGAGNDFYSYDPATDTWESVGTFPTMTGRARASAAAGDRAYVGLGWDLGSADYRKDSWKLSASMVSGVAIEPTPGAPGVAPNPVGDGFTLRMPCAGSGRVSLIDAMGRDPLSREISGESETVDCTALAPGPYLLRAQRGGSVMVKMVVKE